VRTRTSHRTECVRLIEATWRRVVRCIDGRIPP
jgi:hypothetical protein